MFYNIDMNCSRIEYVIRLDFFHVMMIIQYDHTLYAEYNNTYKWVPSEAVSSVFLKSNKELWDISAATPLIMAERFVEQLCEQVDNARRAKDFARIMPHIGMDWNDIRELMKRKIRKLNTTKVRKAACNLMPIDSLLPMDTLTLVLSFNHFDDMKVVSRSFKQCFEQNQENMKRSRQSVIDKYAHHFSPDITYDPLTNNTYVVPPAEEPLMESMRALEDIIIYNDFAKCFNESSMKSGDRVFVQTGHYELRTELEFHNQDIQIIGVGDSVKIEYICDRTNTDMYVPTLCFSGTSKALLENITFEFKQRRNCDARVGAVQLSGHSSLWMNSIKLRGYDSGVSDGSKSTDRCSLNLKSCSFEGHDNFAIFVMCSEWRPDTLNVIGCKFAKHEAGCIKTDVPLRCVGNIFESNLGAIICEPYWGNEKEIKKQLIAGSIIEGNVCKKFIPDQSVEMKYFSLKSWKYSCYDY